MDFLGSTKLSAVVATHKGSRRIDMTHAPISSGSIAAFTAGGAGWEIALRENDGAVGHYRMEAKVVKGTALECSWGLSLVDVDWGTDNFVLLPGAVYGGNRFHAQRYAYSPPAVGPRFEDADRTPWIGDLPRLNVADGPSHLDQLSIDCATPGLGVYFPRRRKGLLILTGQQNDLGPFGLEVLENEPRTQAEIVLTSPGIRHERYFSISGYCDPSPDRTADFATGDQASIDFRMFWFDCESVQELYDFLYLHRTDCFAASPLRDELPFSAAWDLLEEKHNRENWHEAHSLYQVSILQDPPNPFMWFQSGWVGGMMTPYPLLQEGSTLSRERALRNMKLFFSGAQTPFGLFNEYYFEGKWASFMKAQLDAKGISQYAFNPDKQWTLVRRIGDLLYFIFREFQLLRDQGREYAIEADWIAAMQRNLAAVEAVWRHHGEFGQYVDVLSGEVKVAGSTAGALIPAGLVLAAQFIGEDKWIGLAEEIAEKYRLQDLASGITTGGPGDCVQAPDSESIAALIDSFILLYETTGKRVWLQAAEDAVVQTASWALSYDYAFPEGSALHAIGAQSRGVFIANAQNKTGVPGICTLSGQSILRVFRATGNRRYLELLCEIAHAIPQYMGREDKRIPTRLQWGRKGLSELPNGWICERVNVTQWGEAIGEISAYSCWCEIAMMLTWADIPGIYVQPDTRVLAVCDHVEVEPVEEAGKLTALRVHNPTRFPARVKYFIETAAQATQPQPINFAASLPSINIPAGGGVTLKLC
jgi:hypothetical protein